MVSNKSSRKYDLLLIGATGYTGCITAEQIAAHLPTNLKWAIASTSQPKLERLAEKLSKSADRLQPTIEIISVDDEKKLASLVGQSRVCISTVLYARAGEQVVKACAENGTDYVDCAAVPDLVQTWISKYHDTAAKTGAALIHACGALVAPLDLMVWIAAREIDRKWSLKTRDVTLRLDELDTNLSGGTIRTVIGHASIGGKAIAEAEHPSALSPIRHPGEISIKRGVHQHRRLGFLASSSLTADQNRALIYRTWGLLQGTEKSYGPNFAFNEYEKANSVLGGVGLLVQAYVIGLIMLLTRIPFFKNLMLSAAPAAGDGPDVEAAKSVVVSMEAVAVADDGVADDGVARRDGPCKYAHVKFLYPYGHYPVTGLFMIQAAASLLYHRKLEGDLTGGCLTPAVLGDDFVERTKLVDMKWPVELRED
ncbi:Saccharopine dehydrogenase-domain-containing protein [Xylaria intraflava]|nr:Saccharopine dehydrogenase-domain-containing protein [Xylaria intraflava]